jgi:hypothetical protein
VLTACGSDRDAALTRASGTTTTTASVTTTSPQLTTAPVTTRTTARAAAPTTARRPTTTRSTIPGPILIRYRVELHTTDTATATFPADVDAILHDPRGWQQAGFVFERADADGQYTILLGEGPEVRERCRPYDTYGKYSCQIGPLVAITADRWRVGTPEWTGDLASYRQMVVGHEVGHLIGLHHRRCPGRGRPAPLMSQQSTELNGCAPNPWPLPEEVARAARHDLQLAPGYEPGNPTDPP